MITKASNESLKNEIYWYNDQFGHLCEVYADPKFPHTFNLKYVEHYLRAQARQSGMNFLIYGRIERSAFWQEVRTAFVHFFSDLLRHKVRNRPSENLIPALRIWSKHFSTDWLLFGEIVQSVATSSHIKFILEDIRCFVDLDASVFLSHLDREIRGSELSEIQLAELSKFILASIFSFSGFFLDLNEREAAQEMVCQFRRFKGLSAKAA